MKQSTLTLYNEQWLLRRLREQGAGTLDAGDTTPEERRERVRQAILTHGLTSVIIGRGKDGKPMLWPQAFEALYGVPFAAQEASAA